MICPINNVKSCTAYAYYRCRCDICLIWKKECYRLNKNKYIKQYKKHYKLNRHEILKKSKLYRELNPELRRNTALKTKFGITLAEYEEMFDKQNGVCAICLQQEVLKNKRLAVDHNHVTGKIRGLLCGKCNKGLGLFSDDFQLIMKAVNYLKND